MKKLLIFLIVLVLILLIAVGFLLLDPEDADSIFPFPHASSSQAANNSYGPDRNMADSSRNANGIDSTSNNNRPCIVDVVAGMGETVALYSDGSAKVLNKNDVTVFDPGSFTSISVGMFHVVGLRPDGTVTAAIMSSLEGVDIGQCNVSSWTDIVEVSAGFSHTVGLRSNGTVVAAGNNEFGECDVIDWTDIVAVSAGVEHTVGLRSDGTVVATGGNSFGQCNVSNWTDIVAISAGNACTIGLRSDGKVFAAGNNEQGQCNVGGWSDIVKISTSYMITVGLRSDGTVVATELSSMDKDAGLDFGQCNVGQWSDIVKISAGYDHTVGLRSDGTMVAVGNNEYGQCNVDLLSNSAAAAIPEENIVTTVPDQYKGTEFESFLSQLKYPTGPFSFNRSYSTVQVESISIVEIEKSRSQDHCVNITFEVIGTVRGSDLLSLDVDCFDADGYNIYSTVLDSLVSDGNRFKIKEEVLTIPLETVYIEFD